MSDSDARRWLLRLAMIFGCATFLALFFGSRTYFLINSYPDNQISWERALSPALADWYVWAALAPALLWIGARFPVERGMVGRSLPVLLASAFAFTGIKIGLDIWLSGIFDFLPDRSFSRAWVLNLAQPNFSACLLIIVAAQALGFRQRYRDRKLRASQLEAELAKSQLQVLNMQLHPHFLFNTLHAVSTLMHRDVAAAERMIARLADLLRLTIDGIGVQEVTLKQEMDVLERYLEIEQTRFGERLEVDVEIDAEALDARVPNMVLQPLVENAVRHGIAPRSAPGRIEIRGARDEDELVLTVSDTGPGLDGDDLPAWKEGIGLSNTRARLEQLYGGEQRMTLRNGPEGGLRVELSIPFREAAEEP